MEKTISFERGNQARLDVTREELDRIIRGLSLEKRHCEKLVIKYQNKAAKDNLEEVSKLIQKVREALDRSE